MERFHHQLLLDAQAVEKKLEQALSHQALVGEVYRPQRLVQAMRHGALAGGKRLRPFLVMQTGALFDGDTNSLLQVATALECVHCYSLIHDDLPAMDDDDLRRGKPTVHREFDEATAILAGDGLLTFAFELLSDEKTNVDPEVRISLIAHLAKAAGMGGMAGGQMLDLQPETSSPSLDDIARMQTMKTGALIKFACIAGGICGGATLKQISALEKYGELIGRAFQLADDILDVTSSASQLGKGTAKDEAHGKLTQVSTLGIEKAGEMAKELVGQACDALSDFGERADILKLAARFIIERKR
ncbi:MAG: polyprenyl synthetase family protein [Rhizobiaceae bacterium]|nr:polyprenyl synthetase family protein [Rhizobiaceae bacterium]